MVALKVMPLDVDPEEGGAGASLSETLAREITILKRCRSAYVTAYYASYLRGSQLWIALEFCDAGSVYSYMQRARSGLGEMQLRAVCTQVLHGLNYLHSPAMRTIHRDLKAANVLLKSSGEAKLADFGVSTYLQHTLERKQTATGSPYWMAPELIMQEQYDAKVDIWSLGITLIEMAEMAPPYAQHIPMAALFMIAAGDRPPPRLRERERWSAACHDFLAQCLRRNPRDRPAASVLLAHPFLLPEDEARRVVVDMLRSRPARPSPPRRGSTLQRLMAEDPTDPLGLALLHARSPARGQAQQVPGSVSASSTSASASASSDSEESDSEDASPSPSASPSASLSASSSAASPSS